MMVSSFGFFWLILHNYRFEESEQDQGATNDEEVVINSEQEQTCGDAWSIGFVFPMFAS